MSFRLKTVLGIAAIEILLLAVLVLSGLYYIRTSNEERIFREARTAADLLATMTTDAAVSLDLATLDELARQAVRNAGIVYARIRSADGQVLSQSGSEDALARDSGKTARPRVSSGAACSTSRQRSGSETTISDKSRSASRPRNSRRL